MNPAIRAAAILAFAIAPGVHAAQAVLAAGAWDVPLGPSGSMPACTPAYRSIPGVFILNSVLVVPSAPNVSTAMFFYGQAPLPQEARKLGPLEQKSKQLTFTPDEMKKAIAAGRVRVLQESGFVPMTADISLADLKLVGAAMDQCQRMIAPPPAPRQPAQPVAVGLCSAELVQRMFAIGLGAGQVSQVCGAQVPQQMIPTTGSPTDPSMEVPPGR